MGVSCAEFGTKLGTRFRRTAHGVRPRGTELQQRPASPQMRSSAVGAAKQTSPPVSPRSFHWLDPRRVNRSGWSWKPRSRSLNEASAYDLGPQRPT
jgi:hypothetical protein